MTPASSGKPFCPRCGKPATGKFCQNCGSKLGGQFCNQCGAKVAPAAAFCNQCGTDVGSSGHRDAAAATVGGQNLPWWIAGIAMFGLIVVVGTQMVQPGGPVGPNPVPVTGGGALTGPAPDISNMSPIERADALYNRVMQSAADGDSLQAQQFMPMATAAYDLARPLDIDGLFHLSMLQRTGMQLESALATAEEILAVDADHLLGLAAAAEAALELSRPDDAAAYYGHIVDVYDTQMARALIEYVDHEGVTTTLKATAEAFLAGR